MTTVQDTALWKNKNICKASAVSRGGTGADKGRNTLGLGGRGSWWLGTLKDTPVPGQYQVRGFIEDLDLNPVQKTYGFKGSGRRAATLGEGNGELLLPGAYRHHDGTQELLKRHMTYGFKNSPRPHVSILGLRDKNIHTSPCDYDLTSKTVEKIPCKHVMFRSTVQRTTFFPREGPGPCHYHPQTTSGKSITSCFKSTLPRLQRTPSETPGPGSYGTFWKIPDLLHMDDLDPSFSLFFRNLP